MKNKDEALTYEELTALCRKQEEYIKELEDKLIKPSDTEKCIDIAKPDYDELYRHVQSLNIKINELDQENNALRYSLTRVYMQLKSSQAREEMWEEEYHRANKLLEELNK